MFYTATEHRVLTSKAHEEAEEHWIKEAKTDSENVLMDHSGHCEHKEHRRRSETLIRHLKQQKQRDHSNVTHYTIEVPNILSFFKYTNGKKDHFQNHSPTESPDTRNSTTSRGLRHSKCDSNWQKRLNSTNPFVVK